MSFPLSCRDVTGQAGFAGMDDHTQQKPSKTTYSDGVLNARRGYALRGAAASVQAPLPRYRRVVGDGIRPASARIGTDVRVMCTGEGDQNT